MRDTKGGDVCVCCLQEGYGDILLRDDVPAALPLAPPPFTLADVKNAIPRHCFERSLTTSLGHLAVDLIIVAFFFYLATFIEHPALPYYTRFVLWPIWWYAQVRHRIRRHSCQLLLADGGGLDDVMTGRRDDRCVGDRARVRPPGLLAL
jgi:hypothetical protein